MYLYNVLIFAVYIFAFVCYANEIKFKHLPSGLLYGNRSWILWKILLQTLINKVEEMSIRTIFFRIRGQDNPLTFNQYISYFDSFNLSVILFCLIHVMSLTYGVFTQVIDPGPRGPLGL